MNLREQAKKNPIQQIVDAGMIRKADKAKSVRKGLVSFYFNQYMDKTLKMSEICIDGLDETNRKLLIWYDRSERSRKISKDEIEDLPIYNLTNEHPVTGFSQDLMVKFFQTKMSVTPKV